MAIALPKAMRHSLPPLGPCLLSLLLGVSAGPLAGATTAEELIELPTTPNEAIRELAQQVRMTPGGTAARLERIIDLIFEEKNGLGFSYKARPTLTAGEAVVFREGNCLSLVNLTVSIARSAGIDAEYVEVEDFEAFYRQQQTIIRTTHVIAGIPVSGTMMYIDFMPRQDKTYRRLQPIPDRRAAALYYNALAAEAILNGDHERAEKQFRNALTVDAKSAETWNNYAVLQRREGNLQSALSALERAHELDPHLLPAIENLVGMHRRAGRLDEASRYETLAMREKTRNPYFLLHRGLERLNEGNLAEASELLQRARRIEPDEPEIYVALGRVELGKGNERAANRLFAQAQKKSGKRSSGFQMLLQEKIERLLASSETADVDPDTP
jgi:tetratricopeptide (TPR) repeat protein